MLNNGETIGDRYKIVRHLNRGMMANAYEAVCLKPHKRVFFKEYISPRPSVAWYRGFVDHQRELTKALRDSDAAQFCLLPEETFEESSRVTASGERRRTPSTLYQVFEFIDGGLDLEKRLEKSLTWDDRRMFASVFAFGLSKLHAAGVIHADLKPANLQIVEKRGAAGTPIRTPRLIDMDFSILAKKRAPWHGHSGYVGTEGYLSPEHLGGSGSAPMIASDVFTAGVILHDLLGKGNPLKGLDAAEYLKRVRAGGLPPIKLQGSFGSPELDRQLVDVIQRCLAFDPSRRPTSSDLHQVILGRGSAKSAPPPPIPSEGAARSGGGSSGAERAASGKSTRLVLSGSGVSIEFGVTTTVGRSLLERFGSDAQFASASQFAVAREAEEWFVEPAAGTRNETLLNGAKVVARTMVKTGDRLAVGNSAKGVEKLQLRIELKP